MNRQADPNLNGQVRVQNQAFVPFGVRKYPYMRPERGTSIVEACLCHNQTNDCYREKWKKRICVLECDPIQPNSRGS